MNGPSPSGPWPPPGPREPSWDQLFSTNDGGWGPPSGRPPLLPRPPSGGSKKPLIIAAAVIVVVAALIGLVVVMRSSSKTDSAQGSSSSAQPTPTSARPASGADTRLSALLPPGYASGACTPSTAPENGLAAMTCARNGDPGGPTTATYTSFADQAALNAAFTELVSTSAAVECPGRIQSPGPWRRSATAPQPSGTLLCGLPRNRPMVAWTDNEKLLLSSVQGDTPGPNLAQLYTWWSSHS